MPEYPGEEAPSVRAEMQALEKRLVDGLARLDDELCEVRSRESRHAVAAAAHRQVGVLLTLLDKSDERPEGRAVLTMFSSILTGGVVGC